MTDPTTNSDVTAMRHRLDGLLREHAEVKARVAEYQQRRWLSPGEELEMRTLQRLKLRKKDEIAAIEKALTRVETELRFD
jgi:uncharacterized protein YdcH (DUF465 family)